MKDALKPETLSIHEFMGGEGEWSRRKVIPRYQRAYSWEQEYIEDFLSDIDAAMSRDAESYFIGAMLCIQRGEGVFAYHEIVDGQQRLTTLSLIFAVVLRYVRENNTPQLRKELGVNPGAFEDGLSKFLYHGGELFSSLAEKQFRLELSEVDRMSYRQIISDGPPTQAGYKHRRFVDAYRVILDFFEGKRKSNAQGAKYLVDFVKFLAEKVCIVGIFISDEADAYEIFEVLNARNLHLTPVDLIKNKLLSCFGNDRVELEKAYEQWQLAFVACKERPLQIQDYIRCHLQMRDGGKIDPKMMYRHLREEVIGTGRNKKQRAKDLLKDLDGHCRKFSAMLCKDDSFWDGFDSEIKPAVGYLKGFRVVYTIMFGMLYSERPKEFVSCAYRVLRTFIKRTRAVRDRFSIMEQYEGEFAHLARDFKLGKGPKNEKAFFSEIKRIDASGWLVIPDESFINQVSERPRIKSGNAKEMLIDLANHMQKKVRSGTMIDPSTVNLEHILPKNPDYRQWSNFENEEIASLFVDRLGNLTLLESGKNTCASNRKFADKKRLAYAPDKCGIRLTNDLCEFPEWTQETVKKRSLDLAKLAAKVWSFDEI